MTTSVLRLSRILRVIFLVSLVVTPMLIMLLVWNLEWVLQQEGGSVLLGCNTAQHIAVGVVSATTRWLCLAAVAPSVALTCAIYWNLAALFGGYSRGEVFSQASVRRIRCVGVVLLARELLDPFASAAISVFLTMSNPPGQRLLTFGLGSASLTLVITALVVIVVAHVMDQGRELHEESLLTI